jgi:hypothetical protein
LEFHRPASATRTPPASIRHRRLRL